MTLYTKMETKPQLNAPTITRSPRKNCALLDCPQNTRFQKSTLLESDRDVDPFQMHAYSDNVFDDIYRSKRATMQESQMHLNEIELKTMKERIIVLEKQIQTMQQLNQHHLDNLQQNENNRMMLESIFDIDPNVEVDARKLDGLISDCVDEEENSRDVVRRIRGN